MEGHAAPIRYACCRSRSMKSSSLRKQGPIATGVSCIRIRLTLASHRWAAAYGSLRSQGRRMQNSIFKQQTQFRLLAARCARALLRFSPPGNKRAQGKPDARCTRGLVRKMDIEKTHTSIQVQRRHPAFPAQWFYGLFRALPGEPSSFATVTSQIISAKLSASVGRQDHTTSPSARVTLVSRNCRVHRIPPHVRDDSRSAPLIG